MRWWNRPSSPFPFSEFCCLPPSHHPIPQWVEQRGLLHNLHHDVSHELFLLAVKVWRLTSAAGARPGPRGSSGGGPRYAMSSSQRPRPSEPGDTTHLEQEEAPRHPLPQTSLASSPPAACSPIVPSRRPGPTGAHLTRRDRRARPIQAPTDGCLRGGGGPASHASCSPHSSSPTS